MPDTPRLKVAFIGSHGVGKTTLCFGLAARLKARDVAVEIVHEVARRCPLPINEQTSLASESWILHAQVAEELVAQARYPVVICDRSALDNYVYLLLAAGKQPHLEGLVEGWMRSYDLLVHVPIVEELSPDGVRSADPAFQGAVDRRLDQELAERGLAPLRLDPARRMAGAGGPRGLGAPPPGAAAAARRRLRVMPSFEGLLLWLLLVVLAAGAVALLLVLRDTRPPAVAAAALARGDFAAALAAGTPGAPPAERLAAATAARHLLDFAAARALLAPLLAADPLDGEAWLESGLVAAYAGDHDGAERAFARAGELRADLLESLTLHRAWSALARGDRRAARARFEEVEAPLESKLRSDLGPGDPLFAEWFLQAAALWRAAGEEERAEWALAAGRAAAPASRLWQVIAAPSAKIAAP